MRQARDISSVLADADALKRDVASVRDVLSKLRLTDGSDRVAELPCVGSFLGCVPPPHTSAAAASSHAFLDLKFELLRTIHTGTVAVAEWYNFRIPTGFGPRAGAVPRARCASWFRGGRGKCEEDEVKVVEGRDGQGARLGKVGRYAKKPSLTEALPAWAASRSTS